MTRFTVIVGFAVALGAALQNARADEPKPEQIIDKALRAHGGEEKITRTSTGSHSPARKPPSGTASQRRRGN